MTVYVTSTSERLTFPLCVHRQLTATLTVTYSNHGPQDNVTLTVDSGAQTLAFTSEAGTSWNVFKSVTFTGVTLARGVGHATLTFQHLDEYGIEIDYVGVSVDDDFINDDVIRCQLMLGEEPRFRAGGGVPGVSAGYLEQHSYSTPCPEETNVLLPVFHPTVQQYTITASNPLYHSMNDFKTPDFSTCPKLDADYWRFDDVTADDLGLSLSPNNGNNATLTRQLLPNDVSYDVKYTIAFNLKGVKTGFIDADIHSVLTATFLLHSSPSPSPSIKVTLTGKGGNEMVKEMILSDSDSSLQWNIPEMTWTEDDRNYVTIYVSSEEITLETVELRRGYTGPDQATELFKSDSVVLEGYSSDFWWRKPLGQSMTVNIGSQSTRNLSRVALYVHVPWMGSRNFLQIFVLYQDGNVRLAPPPYTSPTPDYWRPFGTFVIVGKSSPSHPRPAAAIQTLTFDPDTLQMSLTYYDGSTSRLTLTYSATETYLKVTDMNFAPSTSGQPFATFRSMFVAFGNTDSDSVQSEASEAQHVLGAWNRLNGTDFLLFRAMESRRLTQSPDIRLTIQLSHPPWKVPAVLYCGYVFLLLVFFLSVSAVY